MAVSRRDRYGGGLEQSAHLSDGKAWAKQGERFVATGERCDNIVLTLNDYAPILAAVFGVTLIGAILGILALRAYWQRTHWPLYQQSTPIPNAEFERRYRALKRRLLRTICGIILIWGFGGIVVALAVASA